MELWFPSSTKEAGALLFTFTPASRAKKITTPYLTEFIYSGSGLLPEVERVAVLGGDTRRFFLSTFFAKRAGVRVTKLEASS